MASFFDFVKAPELKKYKYNLSHDVKLSGRIGDLIPFNWEYLSPGDSVTLNSQIFMRTAPLIHPIFQKMNIDVHHFFIPLRLIWEDFETFITGYDQKTAQPKDTFQVPQAVLKTSNLSPSYLQALVDVSGLSLYNVLEVTSLADYLGFPCSEILPAFGWIDDNAPDALIDRNIEFSLLPFRAYQQVYNDYYRDSIKQTEVEFDKTSNNYEFNSVTSQSADYNVFKLRQRALEKDYFTSSQPTPQLGQDVSVNMPNGPIGTMSSVLPTSGTVSGYQNLLIGSGGQFVRGTSSANSPVFGTVNGLSNAAIITINKLRELFSLQKWADTGNKFGSRYKEQTLGHFGVETPDARLQRAQYLGGGRIPLMINQVSQLSEGSTDSPLGTQAGQGMASGSDNYIEFNALEHGIILSIVSVIPENTYYKGVPRKFLIKDRFDFPFPEFATLGEQEVSSQEINLVYNESLTYGYQERYAEFKTLPNRSAGEFTTNLRNFYLASPQSAPSCTSPSNLTINPVDYDNVFPTDARQADNMYFLISNDFYKYSPLPYINRVTTDYI